MDTQDSLAANPTFTKYAKIIKITRAPVERVIKNMEEDGVSPEDIARFAAVFDENAAPASSGSAASGDFNREAFQKSLDDMEKNIVEKMEKLILDREARLIAALSGGVAAAPAPAPAKVSAPAPAPAPTSTPAPSKPPASKSTTSQSAASRSTTRASTRASVEAEVIESDLCPTDMTQWVALPGIRSSSGVNVEQSCKDAYERVRKDRNGVRWVMFEFDKSFSWIFPTKECMKTEDFVADWANFVETLPEKKAVYALYNFEYEDIGGSGYAQAGSNVIKNKMCLFAWTDSKCRVKDRMVAASSQAAIKQVCRGSVDQPVHDKEDMEFDYMMKELNC
jgi:hypothetical protein